MKKIERSAEGAGETVPARSFRKRPVQAGESSGHATASCELGGGVALEKLREEIARQERWTSGYRLIIDTIINVMPKGQTGRPDLGMIPAHTRDMLAKTERSLAREGAILEQLKAELRSAEDMQCTQRISKRSSGEKSTCRTATKHPQTVSGIAGFCSLESSHCLVE